MEKLKMRYERVEGKNKELIFESEDFTSCLNWTITGLYDVAVKRSKAKIEQYYIDNIEYCKIKITYQRMHEDIKDVYTIYNWRNEWGNFINVQKTFEDNGKEV